MGYSGNALKKIIIYSKQTGSNGNYIELSDSVLNLGQFYLSDATDTEDDPYIDFPCEKCGEYFDVHDLNAHEPYLNYCDLCIGKEEYERETKEYFNSLRRKGLLEEYGTWVLNLYP